MNKKRKNEDDAVREIAPMNVYGMPCYHKGVRQQNTEVEQFVPLSKKESLSITFHAIIAGLSVALIIGLAGFLFILFCIHVWFR